MRATAFGILLAVVTPAHAQENAQPHEAFAGQAINGIVCDPDGSTRTMSACYALWRDHEGALLEQATHRLLDYARTKESERRGAEGDGGYVASITRAQESWLSWRDDECLIVTLDAVGGSIRQISYPACQAGLTAQRHQQLDAVLAFWRADFRDDNGELSGVGCILEATAFSHCER